MKEVLISIFFLGIASASLWGWNHWRDTVQNARDNQPSISNLAAKSKNVVTPSVDESAQQTTENIKPDTSAQVTPKEALDVKVLNGGAVRGSAAKVQGILKQNGYVKAQVGNSIADYTGVSVYYSGSNEANASAIQQLLTKDYPKISVQVATSSKAENGSASVVVILGK